MSHHASGTCAIYKTVDVSGKMEVDSNTYPFGVDGLVIRITATAAAQLHHPEEKRVVSASKKKMNGGVLKMRRKRKTVNGDEQLICTLRGKLLPIAESAHKHRGATIQATDESYHGAKTGSHQLIYAQELADRTATMQKESRRRCRCRRLTTCRGRQN